MKVEMWLVERIKPYARNPRRINDAAIEAVASSIREFGWRVPIVVDEDGVILAGHTRLLAATQKLGMEQVPVHQALGLTEAQKRAYRIADNAVSEISNWDIPKLELELPDLSGLFTGLPAAIDITLPEPPTGVAKNIEALKEIKRKGNTKQRVRGDTEHYLVIVYPSREAREAACVEMGMPADERYLAASCVKLQLRGPAGITGAISSAARTGAHG